MAPVIKQISPQPGPQTEFLACSADIVIYGGAAGGGKTWALLFEAARHVDLAGYYAVIFRREIAQITSQGGLWDESNKLYPQVGAKPNLTARRWKFPSGSTIGFEGVEQESDILKYQGAQFGFLGFDELTHFTEKQFWYLRSRVRTLCGIRPVVRATCNPDPLSWVKDILQPWLSGRVPYGELLWYVRDGDHLIEADKDNPEAFSLTFIPAKVADNRVLMEADPSYIRGLKALPYADRMALLEGSWDIVQSGNMFRADWWQFVDHAPKVTRTLRFWDMAATEAKPGKDPDWSVGVKMSLTDDGRFYIEDVERFRETPANTETRIKRIAEMDGHSCEIYMEEEGGSSGKIATSHYARNVLQGFTFRPRKSTGDKFERMKPLSAAVENGNVLIPSGAPWAKAFINECAAVPNPKLHDDQPDAAAGAFSQLLRTVDPWDWT